jgi:hypothetical protein
MCGLCVTEAELESNPARLGKGTSRLWDLILLGRDGMETETRRLVLLANHAALDGDSICLWLAQILAALPRHAKAPFNEVPFPHSLRGRAEYKESTAAPEDGSRMPMLSPAPAGAQGGLLPSSSSSVVPLGPAMDMVLRRTMSVRRSLNPNWMAARGGL